MNYNIKSNEADCAVPVRETEISRELQRLHSVTENLELVRDKFYARLEGVLSGERLKEGGNAKNPENSSKLGQELNTTNMRLNAVAKGLDELLNRLEL